MSRDEAEFVVRVAAPAIEGKANRALLVWLSEVLGVPRSCLNLLRGERSRHKVVAVDGLSQEEVERRLTACRGGP